MIRTTAALCALAFGLAGCTTDDMAKLQATVDKACATVTTAYSAYSIVQAADLVPASTDAKVQAYWGGTRAICENPPANATDAILQLTAATVYIVKATQAAHAKKAV